MDEYEEKSYDSSEELPIPRQFFWDEDFDYKMTDNSKLLNVFLSSISYKDDPFINSPEKMIKAGFQGTPYKYKRK